MEDCRRGESKGKSALGEPRLNLSSHSLNLCKVLYSSSFPSRASLASAGQVTLPHRDKPHRRPLSRNLRPRYLTLIEILRLLLSSAGLASQASPSLVPRLSLPSLSSRPLLSGCPHSLLLMFPPIMG